MIYLFEVGLLVLLALLSDVWTCRIKNQIIFPFMLVGIITNIVSQGVRGVLYSLCGIVVPVFLLLIFFALKMLGAGDVKLFGAIGAIVGPKQILYIMSYSFIAGGIIALCIMLTTKNGKQRFFYLFQYIKNCFYSFSLLPYGDFKKGVKGTYFRFSGAIACGVLIHSVCRFFYDVL